MNATSFFKVFLTSCLFLGCDTEGSFKSMENPDVGGMANDPFSDSTEDSGLAIPPSGGNSSIRGNPVSTGGAANQATGGASFETTSSSVAGSSSTGGSSFGTGGSSSVQSTGENSTGGATLSIGGSSSSTGGIASTGGSSFVGVSTSFPAISVTYVVRYMIEKESLWPIFRLTYSNRQNLAATIQTIDCLQLSVGSGYECRFTVNQALGWELNACVNADCTQTIPHLDLNGGYCAFSAGIRVYRADGSGLTEIQWRVDANQTKNNCNLVIPPGGFNPTNTEDFDGDGTVNTEDCLPHNPSARKPMVPTDREICWNDLDENCSASYDEGDCKNSTQPANTGTVGAGERIETHQLLPNTSGIGFDRSITVMELIEIEPVYQTWPCSFASVSDPKNGNVVLGIECAVRRDPSKPFVFQAKIGSDYLVGYEDKCAASVTANCAHTPVHSMRDYVRIGNSPYAAFADAQAGYPRTIALSYVSDGDTVRATIPAE